MGEEEIPNITVLGVNACVGVQALMVIALMATVVVFPDWTVALIPLAILVNAKRIYNHVRLARST